MTTDLAATETADAAEQAAQPKVRVRGLWKVFGSSVPAELTPELLEESKADLRERFGLVVGLRDVNFDVQPGETFVVMGLSGSGKSTLVRTLLRLIEPSFGSIEVDGEDIVQFDETQLIHYRQNRTAMVFQHFGLLPHRNVIENAAWGLEVKGVAKEERLSRARATLETVGLKGWEQSRPNTLSGGMQQRVGLARAMAVEPEVLLMDEPFSGLDPLIRRDMQNELVRLQEQERRTIIFITHDLNEALKLGDHIIIMRDGAVVQNGTSEEILGHPADPYVEEFVRDVRKSSVVTLRTLMQPLAAVLHDDMSPKAAMDALSAKGEVAGFVTNRQEAYVGAVSFSSLAEANQRGDRNIKKSFVDDVPPLSADMSISAALPVVRHFTGALPLLDGAGGLAGQIRPAAVVEMMERESAEESEEVESSMAVGADA